MGLAEDLKAAQTKIAELEAASATSKTELDQAKADLAAANAKVTELEGAAATTATELQTAKDAVTAAETARDEAKAKAEASAKEAADLKAKLELSPGHAHVGTGRKPVAGGDTPVDPEQMSDEQFMQAYKAEKDPRKKNAMWKARQKAKASGGFLRSGLALVLGLIAALALSFALPSQAADYDAALMSVSPASTSATETNASAKVVGAIERVKIVITGGSIVPTGTVAFATADGETILSLASLTGPSTNFYRPYFEITTNTAATVAVGQWVPPVAAGNVTLKTTSFNTDNVTVTAEAIYRK